MSLPDGYSDDIDQFNKALKSAGGVFYRLEDGDAIRARILMEPIKDPKRKTPGWYRYKSHYNEEFRGFYCTADDDCPGCATGEKPRLQILIPVLDVDTNKVEIMQVGKRVVDALMAHMKRRKTMLDRNYEISRDGAGQNDTTYAVAPEAPTKMSLAKIKVPDLKMALYRSLTDEFREYVGLEELDDEDQDDADEDEDFDEYDPDADYDDESDEDEDEDERPARRRPAKKAPARKRPAAKGTSARTATKRAPVKKTAAKKTASRRPRRA